MKRTLKNVKDSTVSFVSRNRFELAYGAYVVACFAAGYYCTKKVLEIQQAQVNKEVAHRTLFQAAAAGHQFQYDPTTDTLYDLAIRTDLAS